MKRREFMAGLLSAASMASAQAQRSAKIYRIAIVDPVGPVAEMNKEIGSNLPIIRAFFEELPGLGYVEGQNLLIERYSGEGRAAEGQTAYYPGLASDVVRRNQI